MPADQFCSPLPSRQRPLLDVRSEVTRTRAVPSEYSAQARAGEALRFATTQDLHKHDTGTTLG